MKELPHVLFIPSQLLGDPINMKGRLVFVN